MFDDPIEEDEDIESKDLDARSDGLDVPVMDQAANSSPIAKECAAIPKEESEAFGDNGCEKRQ